MRDQEFRLLQQETIVDGQRAAKRSLNPKAKTDGVTPVSAQVLFIDARKLGTMVDRRHRELTDKDVKGISDIYHAWRGELKDKKYEENPGFCKSVAFEEIQKQGWILTPGRYVGAEEAEDDTEAFEEKMKRLTAGLSEQTERSQKLHDEIKRNLESIGFDV